MKTKWIMYTLEGITMLFWISFLSNADSYRFPYILVTILSFLCFYINSQKKTENGEYPKKQICLGAGIFSVMAAAANYALVFHAEAPGHLAGIVYRLALLVLLFIGGFFSAWHILYCGACRLKGFVWKQYLYQIPSAAVFGMSFAVISVVNLFLLFACRYPGNLTPDSLSQVGQILSDSYSNHHPFYHTMVIRLFLKAGLALFGEINAAVALYHVFQILFMAFCFSMVIVTLYEMRLFLGAVVLTGAWYALMPFHIVYSFTMWKDVMFGGFVVLFSVFLYRVLKKMGGHMWCQKGLLMASGIGICLCRSNGMFAFGILVLSFFALFGKSERKLCVIFASILFFGFFMKHAALRHLQVAQPDTVEALSIPLQQLARVIKDHDDFTNEQKELLNQVVDTTAVSNAYVPWISDPVKELVRGRGNQQYFIQRKLEYLKLYIQVGLKHPLSYMKAWIDETRGYWNAGYDYWRWIDDVFENNYGIQRTVRLKWVQKCLDGYLWMYEKNSFLQIFLCIGFYVWAVLFLFLISIVRKDRVGLVLTIPVLAVVLSLFISTPVYSEFRYAYAVFCCFPFLLFAVLRGDKK